MKRLIIFLNSLLFFMSMITVIVLVGPCEAKASSIKEIKVFVDGVEVKFPDQGPYIDANNRTLVPVRFLVESFGTEVKWEPTVRSVEIKHLGRGKDIQLWTNKRQYIVNGTKNEMDTEAVVTKQGRTVVPVRFIADALDMKLKWRVDANTRMLHTFTKDQTEEEINSIIEQTRDNLYKPVFSENFTDKVLSGYNIADDKGNIIWNSDRVDRAGVFYNMFNSITPNDTLLLGGSEKIQTLSLKNGNALLPHDFCLEFGLTVHSMSNAGLLSTPFQNRPIIEVIPRTRNDTLNNYYSVVYYLENSKVQGLVANMFKCKWEIIRVNGSSIEVLAENYYMLNEKTRYGAALKINNDQQGNVNISFYIDDPENPEKKNNPLLRIKDSSPQRIAKGMSNASFRVGGFDPSGFEYTPIIELENIKAYQSNNSCGTLFAGNSNRVKNKEYSLELPHVISEGAIFQRNKPIPIWGRGRDGETIEVRFKNQTKRTTVADGHWSVELSPETYGGPYTLEVRGNTKEIVLKDIYIGEVFLVAGQSNAEWFIKNSFDKESTIENLVSKTNNGELLLRYYKPQQIISLTPNFTTEGYWRSANEFTIGNSSAIGTFFIEKIHSLNEELAGIPLGLVDLSYGGSTIELFMPDSVKISGYGSRKHSDPIVSGFWNGYMKPLTPIKFKGAFYYQGENSVQLRYEYEKLLRQFIEGMRTEFKDDQLPFILVQLTGYGESYADGDAWPIIREIQERTAKSVDNVGLVTAVDLSEDNPWEIHPRKKKPIGERLAYKAMEMIYKKDLDHRSPEIKNYEIKDSKILAHFDYVSGALSFLNGNTGDLEIAGEDGVWHKAKGTIVEDNTLEAWSEVVSKPVGLRYAYRNFPVITLYDDSQMPVLPFNTITGKSTQIKSSTNEFKLVIPYHGLNDWDGVWNITRDFFRTVTREDVNVISHEYGIPGQKAGDTIILFARRGSAMLEEGSGSEIVVIKEHGLSEGDLIRNTTRSYSEALVIEILDDNTVRVSSVAGQSAGDLLEIYKYKDKQLSK